MSLQVSGGRNLPAAVQVMATKTLEQSREMRYQSFNAYRKRFNMQPYSSFEELTGEAFGFLNKQKIYYLDIEL